MDDTDKKILQAQIAKRVGKAVNEIFAGEKELDEDIRVEIFVENPSCYYDDEGKAHTGKLITVLVDFIEDEDDED